MASWDIIVVGAGSAGAALAVRSAERGKRVLLLEAGPDYRSAAMAEAWRSPNPFRGLMDPDAGSLVWPDVRSARTERQPQALYWRGRGVGGSSSINGQIAIRPPMADYADWAAAGCAGWAPEDVLPYFAKLEDDEEYGDAPYHGRGGPTPIFRMPRERWGAVDSALCAAALAAGHPWAPDVNAPDATGVSPYPINSRDGRRVSVNDAYLEPYRSRPGLTIRGDALVDRLVFQGDRAAGVLVLQDGAPSTEYADEIVLSGGVIHSPAILMRSGVGPAADLARLGIEVRQDLPVGRGMQDHPMILVALPLTEEARIRTPDDRHTNVCVRYEDLMVVSMNQNVLSMETADARFAMGGLGVWLNGNRSRGELTLTSADPYAQPEVHERMLADPHDRARLRQGVRDLVELARSPEVAPIVDGSVEARNAELFRALDDDAALDAHMLATAVDAQHGTSTCRMGDVVDASCRVLGLEGVRVVDASVFPSVPRANTNLAAIMTGELMAGRLD